MGGIMHGIPRGDGYGIWYDIDGPRCTERGDGNGNVTVRLMIIGVVHQLV